MATHTTQHVRYDVRFVGRVQGVYFRATAEQIARSFPVAGWVRNEPDGSVRLVAEGEQADLDQFIDAVRSAKADNIDDMTMKQHRATGEFTHFLIAR